MTATKGETARLTDEEAEEKKVAGEGTHHAKLEAAASTFRQERENINEEVSRNTLEIGVALEAEVQAEVASKSPCFAEEEVEAAQTAEVAAEVEGSQEAFKVVRAVVAVEGDED